MSDVHDVLVNARNRLAQGGVISGQFSDGKGYCARGAILAAVGVHVPDLFENDVPTALQALGALINANEDIALTRTTFIGLVNGVAMWSNSHVCNGQPEAVIEGFDRAIAATAPEPDLSFLTAAPALSRARWLSFVDSMR